MQKSDFRELWRHDLLQCARYSPNPRGGGGEGYFQKNWVGCAVRLPKPLPYFRPKSVIFSTDLIKNLIPYFRPALGAIYMRNFAPARVSYRDDFLILYLLMMTGSFHISLFEGTLHVDKIHVWFKIANITHVLPVPFYRETDFSQKQVVISRLLIPLRDFVSPWNSRPVTRTGVNTSGGDSRWHDILWWYHINKDTAMKGNRSELAPGQKLPRCHIASCKHPFIISSLGQTNVEGNVYTLFLK